MGNFIKLFSLILKRFFSKKKAIMLVIILLLTIFVSNSAFNEYKETIYSVKHFQKLDSSKFKILKNYTQYSLVGVQCFFVPLPLGKLLKTSGTSAELSARVNSIVSLDLFINAKGSSIFEKDSISPFRLSFIILVLGTLSVLFLGYESMRDKEFLKTLSSILSQKKIFIYIVLSKIILLTLIIIGLFAIILILIKINGFTLSNEMLIGLSGYFSSAWIVIMGFFSIGVLVGNIKKKASAFTVLLLIWFVLVFFLPGCLESYIYKKSKNIRSSYNVEFEQLDILNNFEKKCEEEVGKFSEEKRGKFKEFAEYYWNDVYKEIEALEEKIKNDIYAVAKMNKKLAILFPVTFFKLTGDECSSMGLENLLKFYGFLQELKRKFLRFWFDRVYYNDPQELVSFIKGDENLYLAKSQLPGNFGIGVLINMSYIIILLFASFFRFKKSMFQASKNPDAYDGINLELSKNDRFSITTYEQEPANQVINVFFGETKYFKGEITLENESIVTKNKKEFLYIPHPNEFPEDIKTMDLLVLFKRLLKLTNDEFQELKNLAGRNLKKKRFCEHDLLEKAIILISLVNIGKGHTYILKDFTVGLSLKESSVLLDIIEKSVEKNRLVIDINTKNSLWMDMEIAKMFSIKKKDEKYILLKHSS